MWPQTNPPARGRVAPCGGRRDRDPARRRPGGGRRRGPRPDGAERRRQVHPGRHPARPPGLPGDRRRRPVLGEDVTHWATDARAKAGCSWPSSTPSRSKGSRSPSSCARPCQPAGGGHLGARGPLRHERVDGAARHGPGLRGAPPQSGVLRRGEEAQRDPPDGAARAAPGGARRDGLGARHRRTAGGGAGVHTVRDQHPSSACWSSPTISASSKTSSPTGSISWWRAGSSRAAVPSWRLASRTLATTSGGA